jgi:hypothetical protein
MEYVYGVLGFIVLMGVLSWYQQRKYAQQRLRDEMNTMTVRELIKKLKKCDPDEKIIADIKYANYDIRPRQFDDPDDFDHGDEGVT